MPNFTVSSPYKPAGDQPTAIEQLSKSIEDGNKYQTLLGVTGSGKTYTMAKVIEKTKKPTLITIHGEVTVAEFAEKVNISLQEVLSKLQTLGEDFTSEQILPPEYCELLAEEFGIKVEAIPDFILSTDSRQLILYSVIFDDPIYTMSSSIISNFIRKFPPWGLRQFNKKSSALHILRLKGYSAFVVLFYNPLDYIHTQACA